MSQAEELLASLSEGDAVVEEVTDIYGDHMVIGMDRIIMVPESLKRLAVQYDHDVETVIFDCPRYWDGLDMSKMKIYVNYYRADRALGMYLAHDISIDPNDPSVMHFKWTVSGNVTEAMGKIGFIVCIKKADEDGNLVNHWNTELCKDCYISEGLECEDEILALYPDFVTDMLQRMDYVESIATPEHMQEYVDDFLSGRPRLVQTYVDNYFISYPPTNSAAVQSFVTNYLKNNPAVVEKLVKSYMDNNPVKMQEYIDQYFSNDATTIEHVNNFIVENMDELIADGLLTTTTEFEFEKSGTARPTSKGRSLLKNIEGYSYQKKMSGKNKLGYTRDLHNVSYKGVTFTVNHDGSITAKGTPTEVFAMNIYGAYDAPITFPAGNYRVTGGISSTYYIRVRIHEADGTYNRQIYSYVSNPTFNIIDGELISVTLYFNSTATISGITFYPMIVEVTETDLTYEPYCGGTASPNPEFPQVIESTFESGYFDGEWLQGAYTSKNGLYSVNGYSVCLKNKISCKEGDIIKVDFENENCISQIRYWKDDTYVFYDSDKEDYTVPSGVNKFAVIIQDIITSNVTPSTVGKVTITINGKYLARTRFTGKNLARFDQSRNYYQSEYPQETYKFSSNTAEDITATGTGTGLSNDDFIATFVARLVKGRKYKFLYSATTDHRLFIYRDRTWGSLIQKHNMNNTLTWNHNTQDVVIGVYTSATANTISYLRGFMVVDVDETNETYEPYTESYLDLLLDEPLRSKGNVKDEICYQDGKYGVLRRIKQVTDKDITWVAYTPSVSFSNYAVISTTYFTDRLIDGACTGNSLSSHFGEWPDTSFVIYDKPVYKNSFAVHSVDKYYNYGYLTIPWEILGVSSGCTATEMLAAWNTWRADKTITFNYLIEPTFTPFEDQFIFYNLQSYEASTNVFLIGDKDEIKSKATIRFPKNIDGAINTTTYSMYKNKDLALDSGKVRFRVAEDGELEASFYNEEEV